MNNVPFSAACRPNVPAWYLKLDVFVLNESPLTRRQNALLFLVVKSLGDFQLEIRLPFLHAQLTLNTRNRGEGEREYYNKTHFYAYLLSSSINSGETYRLNESYTLVEFSKLNWMS